MSSSAAVLTKLASLELRISALESVVVAYSGGVDSALVAALAYRVLSDRAIAVTAAAETLAGAELDHARATAREIGIDHTTVTYSELDNPEFVRNPKHRCYVCQGMRMDQMLAFAAERDYKTVCDGTNASDPGPDRPGLKAIDERGVVSPLLLEGVDKSMTRALAHHLGLAVADRPANACLSSRIPHGQPVTLTKLNKVERAESLLHQRGYTVVRVRVDETRARVEVSEDEVHQLAQEWTGVEPQLLAAGFTAVTLDQRGYVSGGANRSRAEAPSGSGESAEIQKTPETCGGPSSSGPDALSSRAAPGDEESPCESQR